MIIPVMAEESIVDNSAGEETEGIHSSEYAAESIKRTKELGIIQEDAEYFYTESVSLVPCVQPDCEYTYEIDDSLREKIKKLFGKE